mgnify:CR=1 FL=1
MVSFDWDAFSPEFQAKYNRIRSIPGLGQNVRALTEFIMACIEERERMQADSEPVETEPVKRRGRPPKDKQA